MGCRAPRRAGSTRTPPLLAAVLSIVLAACAGLAPIATVPGPVVGQGSVTSEDRTSGEFQHLSVGGGLRVEVTSGSPVSVKLTAQANLLPLITTGVSGGQLIVNVKAPGVSTSQPMTLTVVVPDLRSVTLSGGANGTLAATVDSLALDVSGGALLEATGRARSLALTASSGAQAKLAGLVADTATVAASGGCQAELNVTSTLSGSATGGATIRLAHPPATLDVTTSGGGSVLGG